MKTEYLLERQVAHVLAALTPENRLVARVCLHTGLRVGDVLSIRTDQLALQFTVTESKTGKHRRVGLTQQLLDDVRAQAGEIWAFPGRAIKRRTEEAPRTRQAVWADIKRASKAFRLPQNVGPHSLRKVYAVDLMNKYGDLKRVQRALQHSSAEITAIYAMADRLLEVKLAQKRKKGRADKGARVL